MTEPVKYRDIPPAFHSGNKSHDVALLIVRAIEHKQYRIAQQLAARLAAETSDAK